MRAAVLHSFKEPLTIEEVKRPAIGAGEVLIRAEACGVCHSDVHIADGDWPQFAKIVKRPLILGHEIAGRVAEKGANVRNLEVGERVGVPWIYWTCGECEFCKEGNENLCTKQKITGVTVDGGYAEYFKVPASHALKIPEKLSAAEAAPLFCAGVTVFRALKQSGIAAGQRLAIFGLGGLGHLALQIGREFGAEVTVVDISEDKLASAKALGAARTLNNEAGDAAKQIRSAGGVHVAIVCSAAKAAYDAAFGSLRPTGTLLAVGLPAENISFPPIMMAAREARIKASSVGTREDVRGVLAMAAAGKLHCQVSEKPLEFANEALELLRKGQVAGRIVLKFPQ